MKYLQITFKVSPDTELVRELLVAMAGEAGCDSFSEEEDMVKGYCLEDAFDEQTLKEGISNFILPDTKIEYKVEKAEDKNWNEEWEKAGFAPIIINNSCVICSIKEENPQVLIENAEGNSPLIIRIDPKQAFGSGTHETTQMIVAQLLGMDLKGKNVLDCGCGTGILSIVAAKCGARKVYGYDIDEWSVRNTIENAASNNVVLEVKEGNRQVINDFNEKFDVVIANINRNILLADMPAFVEAMKPQATLILSGFYEEDVALLEEKAVSLGLKKSQCQANHLWTCLTFHRN
ncbi:50S ribosomal protein L11 methyltransferase [Prevotella intermedia]|uniref:Ribosomal protein L11 methyltransferase n=1 Tax=Prevotella intermedia ZT TaxID=1347790 RepID=A0AAP0V8H3_PREIN|nr:50S ribosomal protein L11 methyltransferase [Prevotella intermedia]ATV33694.1 50S ribosomal protein L11 methyltransferase [Prevotella intermedia]ATV39896.1 50S ribosomal protein L11 methyltransferase [Prevotella intermedia]KJJ86479.1 ribosomal protein L11 methyltransferase [Prevotella intermedia ZT]